MKKYKTTKRYCKTDCERYLNLPKEEKEKSNNIIENNLTEDEKQRLVEYRKKNYKIRKTTV